MNEINNIEVIVIPEVPKVLDNQQLTVYIPMGTNSEPGINTYNADDFIIINGKVYLKNKDEYLQSKNQQFTEDEQLIIRNNIGAITLKDIVIDNELSETSENSLQNKVITKVLNDNTNTVNSALSMINSANDKAEEALVGVNEIIENKLDSEVVSDFAVQRENDNVSIQKSYTNLSTLASSTETELVPLASDEYAGLMSREDYMQLRLNTQNIATLQGQVIRIAYKESTSPTAEEIEAFVAGEYAQSQWPKIEVVVVNTSYVWRYYEGTGWIEQSTVVNTFTNNIAGVIQGSLEEGKVYAETDGTGSIVGWDSLKNHVADLETNKQDTLVAGNNISIVNNIISSINSGVLSFGGATGAITLGNGLTISNNELSATGQQFNVATNEDIDEIFGGNS